MTIQAVLWDNDGVLVDSETVFFETTRLIFARLGLNLTKEIWGAQYLSEGKGTHEIAISLGIDHTAMGAVIDDRNELYRIALKQPPELRPLVIETLTALFGHVKMGIVTGCHREQLQLMHDSNELLSYFDVIITADDYDDPKPSPVPYLAALQALKLKAENCLAVEDSRRGLISATTAGIVCLVVPTDLTKMQDFSAALAIENDVSSIVNHIQQNGNFD